MTQEPDKNEISIREIINLQKTVGMNFDIFEKNLLDEGFTFQEITIAYINCIATLMKNISALYGAFSARGFDEEESIARYKGIMRTCLDDAVGAYKEMSLRIEFIETMTSPSDKFFISDGERERLKLQIDEFFKNL